MSRYERKLFFEMLVALRVAYRAETHASSGMTVDQAIAHAERVYNDAAAADATADTTSQASPTTGAATTN